MTATQSPAQPQPTDTLEWLVGKLVEIFPTPGYDLQRYLMRTIRYPREAMVKDISGKVYINYIIKTDGSITDASILSGPGYGLNEEALRVVALMPGWRPGYQNGRAVRVQMMQPIIFGLSPVGEGRRGR